MLRIRGNFRMYSEEVDDIFDINKGFCTEIDIDISLISMKFIENIHDNEQFYLILIF